MAHADIIHQNIPHALWTDILVVPTQSRWSLPWRPRATWEIELSGSPTVWKSDSDEEVVLPLCLPGPGAEVDPQPTAAQPDS